MVSGHAETRDLKSLLPDILKQLGPQQLSFLKDFIGGAGGLREAEKGQFEDDDNVPELVGTNFEEASKENL